MPESPGVSIRLGHVVLMFVVTTLILQFAAQVAQSLIRVPDQRQTSLEFLLLDGWMDGCSCLLLILQTRLCGKLVVSLC